MQLINPIDFKTKFETMEGAKYIIRKSNRITPISAKGSAAFVEEFLVKIIKTPAITGSIHRPKFLLYEEWNKIIPNIKLPKYPDDAIMMLLPPSIVQIPLKSKPISNATTFPPDRIAANP